MTRYIVRETSGTGVVFAKSVADAKDKAAVLAKKSGDTVGIYELVATAEATRYTLVDFNDVEGE